jgi:hypothetical protein
MHVLLRFLEDQTVERKVAGLKSLIKSALGSTATNPWQPDYRQLKNPPARSE